MRSLKDTHKFEVNTVRKEQQERVSAVKQQCEDTARAYRREFLDEAKTMRRLNTNLENVTHALVSKFSTFRINQACKRLRYQLAALSTKIFSTDLNAHVSINYSSPGNIPMRPKPRAPLKRNLSSLQEATAASLSAEIHQLEEIQDSLVHNISNEIMRVRNATFSLHDQGEKKKAVFRSK